MTLSAVHYWIYWIPVIMTWLMLDSRQGLVPQLTGWVTG